MSKKDNNDSSLFAFLGILLTIIGFIIVYATRRNDKYALFYAKQGLVLFIAALIIVIVGWIPFAGEIISTIAWVIWLVLWVIGMIYSLSGKMKEVFIIAEFARKIDLK